jgi:hypothetical protein
MTPYSIIGAIGGALLGSLIWGGIAYFTGYEIGYVALLVGFVVGLGASILDGEGPLCGFVCAVLCVLSIFGGKYMALSMTIDNEFGGFMEAELTEDLYQEIMVEAEAYVNVDKSDCSQILQFMVDYEYADVATAAEISEEELNFFWEYSAPNLIDIGTNKPSFEQWKKDINKSFDAEIKNSFSLADAIKESLDPIDLLFIVLGISAAYRVGAGGAEGEQA